jgi:hypothetical protein
VRAALFDRAAKLEACIRKPLRCELPPVVSAREQRRQRAEL